MCALSVSHRRAAFAALACCAPCVIASARGQALDQPAVQATRSSSCTFIGNTLVPRLAMGVRRVDGENIDTLELRQAPGSLTTVREAPLFRPYYVAGSGTDAAGGEWTLLQDGYTAVAPLGWARTTHLHQFDSRYAYTFAAAKPEQLAELHDESKESYERLLAQIKGNNTEGEKTVVVKARPEAEAWNPISVDDMVPFVELRMHPEKRDREYPDTTPTFRFGIPVENRLVHMGAMCGGPVDGERLRQLKATYIDEKGIEMLFVIDDTVSMAPFNKVVATFIRDAGALAADRPVPAKIAVCSYRDGPEKPINRGAGRVTLGEFREVKGPADVEGLAKEVEGLGNYLPPDAYANPPERMLEGLRDALEKTKFQDGATLFVVVVGDTGHEPTDPQKPKLVNAVADLINQKGASVHFMHVGRRQDAAETLFKDDYAAIAKTAGPNAGNGRVVYQAAEAGNLSDALVKARNAVEQERRRLQRQIQRMESRTPFTEPGPKLLTILENRGIDKSKFDDRHLQYFVPSRGWLFHPSAQNMLPARPQFRELFFLAAPEREAVNQLFVRVRDRLSRGDQIDSDATIAAFAKNLATASSNTAVEERVMVSWKRIPQAQRSVGVFMEDVFGLRLKAALTFPTTSYEKDRSAAAQEIERMLGRIGRLSQALKDGGDKAFWFEASALVP